MPDDLKAATRAADLGLPFARSWWIDAGRIIGGCYPGTPDPAERDAMLSRLLDVNVRVVVNLQEADERGANGLPFPDYAPRLMELAAARGVRVSVTRCATPDTQVPGVECVERALAAIATLGHLERAYVHCWGGHGRTGTVAGCWMVGVGGLSVEKAFERIAACRHYDRHLRKMPAPQTDAQRQFVRDWALRGGPTS